jgi:hypothetical protein
MELKQEIAKIQVGFSEWTYIEFTYHPRITTYSSSDQYSFPPLPKSNSSLPLSVNYPAFKKIQGI